MRYLLTYLLTPNFLHTLRSVRRVPSQTSGLSLSLPLSSSNLVGSGEVGPPRYPSLVLVPSFSSGNETCLGDHDDDIPVSFLGNTPTLSFFTEEVLGPIQVRWRRKEVSLGNESDPTQLLYYFTTHEGTESPQGFPSRHQTTRRTDLPRMSTTNPSLLFAEGVWVWSRRS